MQPQGSDKLLAVAYFSRASDPRPRSELTRWPRLVEKLQTWDEREAKDGPLWSPTLYRPGATRGVSGVVHVSCLVADVDHTADVSLIDALERVLSPYAYAMHSTWSWGQNGSVASRWVVPLASPVPADQFPPVWARWAAWLRGAGVAIDPACRDASRMYYLPSHPPGGAPVGWVNEGDWFAWDALPGEGERVRGCAPPPPSTADIIYRRALERAQPGNRNNTALWLACQLRDNGYPQDAAAAWLERFAREVPGDGFTLEEARHALMQAYRRPGREPWGRSQRRPRPTAEEVAYRVDP